MATRHKIETQDVADFVATGLEGDVKSSDAPGHNLVYMLRQKGLLECIERGLSRLTDVGRAALEDYNARMQRRAEADAARDAKAEIAAIERRLEPIPKTRAECLHGPRPCPHIRCRHHLGIDISEDGNIKINIPRDATELAETCSLDVAARGGMTLDEVGQIMGVTRERVRQIEAEALYAVGREFWKSGLIPDRPLMPTHIKVRNRSAKSRGRKAQDLNS